MRNRPMKAGPAEAAVLRQLKRRRRRESSGGEEGGSIEWSLAANQPAGGGEGGRWEGGGAEEDSTRRRASSALLRSAGFEVAGRERAGEKKRGTPTEGSKRARSHRGKPSQQRPAVDPHHSCTSRNPSLSSPSSAHLPDSPSNPSRSSHLPSSSPLPPIPPSTSPLALPCASTVHRPRFIYGNYDAYYGYRHLKGAVGPEPRVLALREEWFRGRECLDVGCNAGQLTLSLATRYNSASFLGVDIDAKLISRARTQLNAARSANSGNGKRGERVEPSATERGSEGGLTPMTNEDFRALLLPATARGGAQVANASAGAQDVNREVGRQPAPSAASLPRPRLNVRFEHCNFVQQPPSASQPPPWSFDTVLCLSTSKWVHLNFGDEGIRTLFSRVFACLRPGGHFIFEPQPWSSYRKLWLRLLEQRANLTPAIALNFKQIRLRPQQFVECLLSEIGFSSVEQLDVPYTKDYSVGFKRRPLFVFTK